MRNTECIDKAGTRNVHVHCTAANAEIAALKDAVANAGASTPAMDAAFASISDKLSAVTAAASQLANTSPPVI